MSNLETELLLGYFNCKFVILDELEVLRVSWLDWL